MSNRFKWKCEWKINSTLKNQFYTRRTLQWVVVQQPKYPFTRSHQWPDKNSNAYNNVVPKRCISGGGRMCEATWTLMLFFRLFRPLLANFCFMMGIDCHGQLSDEPSSMPVVGGPPPRQLKLCDGKVDPNTATMETNPSRPWRAFHVPRRSVHWFICTDWGPTCHMHPRKASTPRPKLYKCRYPPYVAGRPRRGTPKGDNFGGTAFFIATIQDVRESRNGGRTILLYFWPSVKFTSSASLAESPASLAWSSSKKMPNQSSSNSSAPLVYLRRCRARHCSSQRPTTK